jgi:hypothetical protein
LSWIGTKNVAFILAHVNAPEFGNPPANWENFANNRIFSDIDPVTAFDRSFSAYVRTVSYGRAQLGGQIFGPYDVLSPNGNPNNDCSDAMNYAIRTAGFNSENPTPANEAVRAVQGLITGFTNACVIFPAGSHCNAWAWWGFPTHHFYPGSTVGGFCRINMDHPLGVIAMENIHHITGFGDLYGMLDSPKDFDVMDCACGTHPSSYTKIKLGWIDNTDIKDITFKPKTTTVSVLALATAPTPNRFHTIKVPSTTNKGYFLIECRLRLDNYESSLPGVSNGIPSEGIVVYYVDESSWPPVHLRTPTALVSGKRFDIDQGMELNVISQEPDGCTINITRKSIPKKRIGAKHVSHGVMTDGGGWIIIGNKIVRVPPRNPLYNVIEAVSDIFSADKLKSAKRSDSVRRKGYEGIAKTARKEIKHLNDFGGISKRKKKHH